MKPSHCLTCEHCLIDPSYGFAMLLLCGHPAIEEPRETQDGLALRADIPSWCPLTESETEDADNT